MDIDHNFHIRRMLELVPEAKCVLFVLVVEPEHVCIAILVTGDGRASGQIYSYTESNFLKIDDPIVQRLGPCLKGFDNSIVFDWPDEWIGFQPESDVIEVQLAVLASEGRDLRVTIGNDDFVLPYLIPAPTSILEVVHFVETTMTSVSEGKKVRVICHDIGTLETAIQTCLEEKQ